MLALTSHRYIYIDTTALISLEELASLTIIKKGLHSMVHSKISMGLATIITAQVGMIQAEENG